MLTIERAAEQLAISEKSLRRRIADGALPTVRIGRLVRIREADLDAYILASLRTEEKPKAQLPWQSSNVVEFGRYASKSPDAKLSDLLEKERRGRTRSNSKRSSAGKS